MNNFTLQSTGLNYNFSSKISGYNYSNFLTLLPRRGYYSEVATESGRRPVGVEDPDLLRLRRLRLRNGRRRRGRRARLHFDDSNLLLWLLLMLYLATCSAADHSVLRRRLLGHLKGENWKKLEEAISTEYQTVHWKPDTRDPFVPFVKGKICNVRFML